MHQCHNLQMAECKHPDFNTLRTKVLNDNSLIKSQGRLRARGYGGLTVGCGWARAGKCLSTTYTLIVFAMTTILAICRMQGKAMWVVCRHLCCDSTLPADQSMITRQTAGLACSCLVCTRTTRFTLRPSFVTVGAYSTVKHRTL